MRNVINIELKDGCALHAGLEPNESRRPWVKGEYLCIANYGSANPLAVILTEHGDFDVIELESIRAQRG